MKPTTVTTIGQAYYCILEHYFKGPIMDHRDLLLPAFAGLTQELQRRGLDQAQATLPAFTGDVDDDWSAFSQVLEQIMSRLPNDAVRQAMAESTMLALVGSLNDNHAEWVRGYVQNMTGIQLSCMKAVHPDSAATAPVFIVEAGVGARSAGILPGDEIVTINGVPPFINGELSTSVIKWVTDTKPDTPIQFTLRRPTTGATFNVTFMPGPQGRPPLDTGNTRLLDGNIGYFRLRGFSVEFVDNVLSALAEMRQTTQLRGMILDLRRNGGGSPEARDKLLGALVHDKAISYWCEVEGWRGSSREKDRCTANVPNNSVPLINLPLVVLTDRGCASACDSFVSTVKDLHLGTLVGTRTAGEASGNTETWALENGTGLMMPHLYEIAANKEFINTVGVAADYFAPVTSADVSSGRDPGIDKALQLLK